MPSSATRRDSALSSPRSSTSRSPWRNAGTARRGTGATDSRAICASTRDFSRSRRISTSSSRSAVSFGVRRVQSRNSTRFGIDLRFAALHQRLEDQPRGAPEDLPPQDARFFEAIRTKGLDLAARVGEPSSGLAHGLTRLRRHRHLAVVLEDTDASARGERSHHGEWHGMAVRIADVGSSHHVEQRLHVVHRPRHGPDDAGEREGAAAGREVARGGHAAGRRLQPANPAEVRRHADGPAAVAADAACRKPGGNCGRLAAARSSWRPIERPRASRLAVQRVVGLPRHQLLGDVGHADDDRPGGLAGG